MIIGCLDYRSECILLFSQFVHALLGDLILHRGSCSGLHTTPPVFSMPAGLAFGTDGFSGLFFDCLMLFALECTRPIFPAGQLFVWWRSLALVVIDDLASRRA